MPTYTVRRSARLNAPATAIYDTIADYRTGHPQIVPPRYFGPIVVERGGRGEGTVIAYSVKAFGRTIPARAAITEPVPGRQLVESDLASGLVTTFEVLPDKNGAGTNVTISTAIPWRSGVLGAIERIMMRWFLLRVYRQELSLLESYCQAHR